MLYKKISLLNFVCNIIHFNLDVESVMVNFSNYLFKNLKENPKILEMSEFQVNDRITFISNCFDSLIFS